MPSRTDPDPPSDRRRGRLRRAISSWANSSDQHARDLRETAVSSGLGTIADAPNRERIRLAGSLQTVTLRPRGGVPALEADMYDGTGVITLVWLGRRRIAGIEPGRSLIVEGRIGLQERTRVMYNPKYELT